MATLMDSSTRTLCRPFYTPVKASSRRIIKCSASSEKDTSRRNALVATGLALTIAIAQPRITSVGNVGQDIADNASNTKQTIQGKAEDAKKNVQGLFGLKDNIDKSNPGVDKNAKGILGLKQDKLKGGVNEPVQGGPTDTEPSKGQIVGSPENPQPGAGMAGAIKRGVDS